VSGQSVTFEMVVDQLRKRDFAVLSTSDEVGTPTRPASPTESRNRVTI